MTSTKRNEQERLRFHPSFHVSLTFQIIQTFLWRKEPVNVASMKSGPKQITNLTAFIVMMLMHHTMFFKNVLFNGLYLLLITIFLEAEMSTSGWFWHFRFLIT